VVICLEGGADCLHIIIIIIIKGIYIAQVRKGHKCAMATNALYGPSDATAIPKPHHILPHLNPDGS